MPENSLLVPTGRKATTQRKLHRAYVQPTEHKSYLLTGASPKRKTDIPQPSLSDISPV